MAIVKAAHRTRWSWIAVVFTSIACACGGGHDAQSGSEPPRESTPFTFGDNANCAALVVTATGSGTTTTPGNWSGSPENLIVPTSLSVSSGTTSGFPSALLSWGTATYSTACTYNASNDFTFSFASCSEGAAPGDQYSADYIELSLVVSGSGGTVTISLPLGSVPLSDGNPCTVDTCNPGGGVTVANVPSGLPCSPDNNVCMGTGTCESGTCTAVVAPSTTPPNTCLKYNNQCLPGQGPIFVSNNTCSTPSGTGTSFDSTIPTNLVNSASSLWSSGCTCNTSVGCASNCIVLGEVGVVRGRVLQSAGSAPVPNATVTILNHPESSVLTRSDGWFDIPVNAGAEVTLQIQAPAADDLFTVQRHVQTRWHQYSVLPDIWMTAWDSNANTVPVSSSTYQIASGSTITSSDITGTPGGWPTTRTARVLFPPSTGANFTYGPCSDTGACGSGDTCIANVCTGPAQTGNLTVRATEYTIPANGPQAMPGDLPASSAYTYAVELSADQAAGANGITFTNPVSFYVENLLAFASGSTVPVGYYDRIAGAWKPSANGAVVGITGYAACSTYSSCAVLDTPSQALGLSYAELNQLSIMYKTQYPSGVSLWRFTTTHFSGWDANWPYTPPPTAIAPPVPPPAPSPPPAVPDPCLGAGSIIECDNQILAQQLPLAGTPFSLRYQSDRAPGRFPSMNIPLTDGSIPSSLDHILVTITIAGVTYSFTFPKASLVTDQTFSWTWDQLDAYGDTVQGIQSADVKVSYVYPAYYVGLPQVGTETVNEFLHSTARAARPFRPHAPAIRSPTRPRPGSTSGCKTPRR